MNCGFIRPKCFAFAAQIVLRQENKINIKIALLHRRDQKNKATVKKKETNAKLTTVSGVTNIFKHKNLSRKSFKKKLLQRIAKRAPNKKQKVKYMQRTNISMKKVIAREVVNG